ncbi:MAG: hypothetical protein ACRDIU_06635 [Actinomycetota bacterium]
MARLHLTIDLEPTDETYASLLQLASRWCSMALLVVRDRLGLSELGAHLTKELEPFLLERSTSSSWPGTTLLKGSASVSTYRLDPTVVERLSAATTGLYGWQQPELPEDLCLLRRDGDPWLVTIAHEGDGFVVLEPTELEELLRDLPDFAAVLREETDGEY